MFAVLFLGIIAVVLLAWVFFPPLTKVGAEGLFLAISCKLDKPAKCVELGELLEKHSEQQRALDYYMEACDAKVEWGCGSAAALHEKQGNSSDAISLYDKACDMGSAFDCTRAAVLVEQRNGTWAALPYIRKACDQGLGNACYYLDCRDGNQEACTMLNLLSSMSGN